MESFFVSPKNVKNGWAEVTGEEFHHLVKVSRKKVGELIYLFDGTGKIYTAKIVRITKENAECEIVEENFMKGEIEVDLSIGQAILKNPERFEFAIEKLTELGVKRIIPLITERVIPARAPKDVSSNKVERWRRIVLSACKQSNRAIIPELCEPLDFKNFISSSKEHSKKIIFHEGEQFERILLYDYLEELKNANSILIAIGPEGGFSDGEIEMAISSGFDLVSLGDRRLRSETASVVGAGVIIQFLISKARERL